MGGAGQQAGPHLQQPQLVILSSVQLAVRRLLAPTENQHVTLYLSGAAVEQPYDGQAVAGAEVARLPQQRQHLLDAEEGGGGDRKAGLGQVGQPHPVQREVG